LRSIAARLIACARAAAAAGAVAAMLAAAGCAGPGFYAAALDSPDGIGPGDPVTHAGATIGSVTRVTPSATGDSSVDFRVQPQYTGAIHQDSIMQLSGAGAAPSLEVINPDPASPGAANGALLFGAANQSQAQLLMTSLGPPSFVGKYANFFQGLSNSSPGAQPSPSNAVLANQLFAIMRQSIGAAAAATGATPATRAQADQFRRDAAAVERQLVAHGRSAEAARLRSEVEQMNAAAAAASAPPGTTTIPRAYPTP
jgi:MlaD protein